MRSTMIAGALVLTAAALGCEAEVRTGSGAYTPPPRGEPVYHNAPTQAAANTPTPVVTPPAAQVTPAPAPAPPAPPPGPLVTPASTHVAGNPTLAPNGTTSSGVHFNPSLANVFGAPTSGALKGTLYYIPNTTQQFPDVTKLTPQGTIYTNQLNVPMHDFSEGFPGVSNRTEWFAIRYDGTFNATRQGVYTFGLNSEDGSNLYIDGVQIINNDGRHLPEEKDGTVQLNPGPHSIRVDFFKGLQWVVALQLYCTPPGGQKAIWSQTM